MAKKMLRYVRLARELDQAVAVAAARRGVELSQWLLEAVENQLAAEHTPDTEPQE